MNQTDSYYYKIVWIRASQYFDSPLFTIAIEQVESDDLPHLISFGILLFHRILRHFDLTEGEYQKLVGMSFNSPHPNADRALFDTF